MSSDMSLGETHQKDIEKKNMDARRAHLCPDSHMYVCMKAYKLVYSYVRISVQKIGVPLEASLHHGIPGIQIPRPKLAGF